ncbi:DeoR/GlpR family DNA-binding transcription regulator [Arthrobacter cryoconiti]|uniref:DeoR/GlpR family DNA-binding transcription regulator n=2 Tax=Arthrobacter cryoconiti TaxID=748907 RepID=A0ABV8R3Y7_9MICC|nr:DeoR/GlpR family DNA-binding transcription regulator [Arthrobacter cryoconiti]
MLAPERQARILKQLQLHEAVRVVDVAAVLNVSEMTIRRDIESLDHSGLVRKIHGGAMRLARLSALEPGFLLNVDKELDAKISIAIQGVALVQPGMTLALTGGTTTYQFAVHLAAELERIQNLTVVTNSLKVADLLYQRHGSSYCKVIVTGGERTPSEALVGPVARLAINSLNTDMCFMGVHGLDTKRGLSSPNLLEAETNAAFIESTSRLVVLADSSKFGVRSLATIAPLSAVDTILSDGGLEPAVRDAFAALVPTFTMAPAIPESPTKQSRKSS